jgi:hypothetical protein
MGSQARTAAKILGGAGALALALWLAPASPGWLGNAFWIAARFLGIWCLVSIPATVGTVIFMRSCARANEALDAKGRRTAISAEVATK